MAALQGDRRGTRAGVPDGYGGRREVLEAHRADDHRKAQEMVTYMIAKDIVAPESELAEEALTFAISVVRGKTDGTATKLAAAKLVLDFTKQRPAATTNLNVRKAEDFLSDIADQMQKD